VVILAEKTLDTGHQKAGTRDSEGRRSSAGKRGGTRKRKFYLCTRKPEGGMTEKGRLKRGEVIIRGVTGREITYEKDLYLGRGSKKAVTGSRGQVSGGKGSKIFSGKKMPEKQKRDRSGADRRLAENANFR